MRHILFAYFTVTTAIAFGQNTFHGMVDDLISRKVPVMSVETLKSKLDNGDKLVVLDSREKKEYTVSHIKNARYCGYKGFNKKAVAHLDRSTPIVIYCSVGYRSGKIGEKLKRMGFQHVANLYGGIFEWVNSGYPVYNATGKTDQVHGYSPEWGKWLRRGEKVYK